MSDTEQDPLTNRLAYLAGTMDDDDRPTLSDMLKTARAYLAPHIAGNTQIPYEQWLDSVDEIEVETPENPTE